MIFFFGINLMSSIYCYFIRKNCYFIKFLEHSGKSVRTASLISFKIKQILNYVMVQLNKKFSVHLSISFWDRLARKYLSQIDKRPDLYFSKLASGHFKTRKSAKNLIVFFHLHRRKYKIFYTTNEKTLTGQEIIVLINKIIWMNKIVLSIKFHIII